jgi:hypothetical protein
MKADFTPIPLKDYVDLHLRANPEIKRTELLKRLESAISALRAGTRCKCGSPIWIVGSAQAGLGCFTCITGQPKLGYDYEIDVAADGAAR